MWERVCVHVGEGAQERCMERVHGKGFMVGEEGSWERAGMGRVCRRGHTCTGELPYLDCRIHIFCAHFECIASLICLLCLVCLFFLGTLCGLVVSEKISQQISVVSQIWLIKK